MHIPVIHTPYQTLFQRALQHLLQKVEDYTSRPIYETEIDTPRDVIEGFIVASAEETLYESDARQLLSLAVEDLEFATTQPKTFEVDPQDNHPPSAEYLIRTNVEEWIAKQLSHHVQRHPPCCEICGCEQAHWFWFPSSLVGGDVCRWGIGEACKAKLSRGEHLSFTKSNKPHSSKVTSLIPIEKEEIVTPALTYRTLAERLAQAQALFDGWLDHLGRMPDLQDVDNCIIHITSMVVPNLFREPLHLILLAIEEPTLAIQPATHYSDWVDTNSEEITAILLLHRALMTHVETRLHQHWQERTSGK